MKFTINQYTISIKDEHIKGYKSKEKFISDQLKSKEWMNIDENVLSEKLGEIYDLLVPPKKKDE